MIKPSSFVKKIKELNPMTSTKHSAQRAEELGTKIPNTNVYKFKVKREPVGGGASAPLKKASVDLAKGKKYIGGGASKKLISLSKALSQKNK